MQKQYLATGQVTLPGHHGKANHALVFMLAGLSTRWKQVVAYYFRVTVYGSAIKPIVTNLIKEAHSIGLNVVVVTSDTGSCNRAMWRSFCIQCGKHLKRVNKICHPSSPSDCVHFMANAPHVLKKLEGCPC